MLLRLDKNHVFCQIRRLINEIDTVATFIMEAYFLPVCTTGKFDRALTQYYVHDNNFAQKIAKLAQLKIYHLKLHFTNQSSLTLENT